MGPARGGGAAQTPRTRAYFIGTCLQNRPEMRLFGRHRGWSAPRCRLFRLKGTLERSPLACRLATTSPERSTLLVAWLNARSERPDLPCSRATSSPGTFRPPFRRAESPSGTFRPPVPPGDKRPGTFRPRARQNKTLPGSFPSRDPPKQASHRDQASSPSALLPTFCHSVYPLLSAAPRHIYNRNRPPKHGHGHGGRARARTRTRARARARARTRTRNTGTETAPEPSWPAGRMSEYVPAKDAHQALRQELPSAAGRVDRHRARQADRAHWPEWVGQEQRAPGA